MNPRNYQKELDRILKDLKRTDRVPHLLLHSCCGPCSSYVLEYLAPFFKITVFQTSSRGPNMSTGLRSSGASSRTSRRPTASPLWRATTILRAMPTLCAG